jgi:SAM-dependent methyltransferase
VDQNLRTYNATDVVSWYSHQERLFPAEEKVFERHRSLLAEAHVLDIGIGGGRTTRYLLDNCREYTGIDYSEELVKLSRMKFPGADISEKDARNLSAFDDNAFDFVVFSFNGIDYVDLDGRNDALREIHRVLTPGGVLFFSTHNKDHRTFRRVPWRSKENRLMANVKTFVKLSPFFLTALRNRRMDVVTDDYAVINDFAHQYRLMTFYTSPVFLRTQLLSHQFADIAFYNKAGDEKDDGELDDWIFVTCRKPRQS